MEHSRHPRDIATFKQIYSMVEQLQAPQSPAAKGPTGIVAGVKTTEGAPKSAPVTFAHVVRAILEIKCLNLIDAAEANTWIDYALSAATKSEPVSNDTATAFNTLYRKLMGI